MDVGIDQAGDNKFAGAVDDPRAGGHSAFGSTLLIFPSTLTTSAVE